MKSLQYILSKNSKFHSLNDTIKESLRIGICDEVKVSACESLRIGIDDDPYQYHPTTFDELRQIIEKRFEELGYGTVKEPIDFNDIDVSGMKTFYSEYDGVGIFQNIKFEYIDISNWDISNIIDMTSMFYDCVILKTIGDLSHWNVSNVENISKMFYNCSQLESIGDISKWNVSNIENMSHMFHNCHHLTNINLSKWDVSNVEDMSNMFDNCIRLHNVGNLDKWNISNVTDIKCMFCNCFKLKSVGDLSNWDVSNVENTGYMFKDSGITNKPKWYKE